MEETATSKTTISELSNIDWKDIDLSIVIDYLITFGKNLIIAIIVFTIGRFLIRYATKAIKAITQKRHVEASLSSFLYSLVSISTPALSSPYSPQQVSLSAWH